MSSRLARITDWETRARRASYSVEKLARIVKATPRQLERYFLANFDATPKHWMDELRIAKAARLIRRGTPLKRVAIELGFKHQPNFTRAYERINGSAPSKSEQFESSPRRGTVANR